MLQVFLEEPRVSECTSIRQVICSGEALSPNLEVKFSEFVNAHLDNLYGPTESAIDVSWWSCKRSQHTTVPIGKAITNIQLYIVDIYLDPVLTGTLGELHIGGVGLARGYYKRTSLTAEKFIPNPFSSKPNERLYKTGDLTLCLPDSNIIFLGRMDYQVKIRGVRIELGEIESTLIKHPKIKEAILLAKGEETHKHLVAYIIPKDTQLTLSDLRTYLKG